MANSGRLGHATITPGQVIPLYAVPRGDGILTSNITMVSVNIVNRGNQAAAVSIALCEDGVYTPTGANWIEYNTEVVSHGVLERTSILLSDGQSLWVTGNDVNLTAVVMGVFTGELSENNLLENGEFTDTSDPWILLNATYNPAGTVTVDDGGTGTTSYITQYATALAQGTYAWEINLRDWAGDAENTNNRVNYYFTAGIIYAQGRFTRAGLHRGSFEVLAGDPNIGQDITAEVVAQFVSFAEIDYIRLYKVA